MTKMEFLEGLRKALGNDLDRATVQENVNYYDGYISDEVSKGKTEEEVTAELGDPWVIAQTVIDAEEAKRGMSKEGSAYTSSGRWRLYERRLRKPESGISDTCAHIWL